MKPLELKKIEKRINLLYALYDAEDGAEEKAYLRKQLDKLCTQLYGTVDAPERRDVIIAKNAVKQPELSIKEIVELLNAGATVQVIAEKAKMSESNMGRIISKYIDVQYTINDFLPTIIDLLSSGMKKIDISNELQIGKSSLSPIITYCIQEIYSEKEEPTKLSTKYKRVIR